MSKPSKTVKQSREVRNPIVLDVSTEVHSQYQGHASKHALSKVTGRILPWLWPHGWLRRPREPETLKSLSLALLVKGFVVVVWDLQGTIYSHSNSSFVKLLSWCLTSKEMEKEFHSCILYTCLLPGLWTSKLGESLCMAWSSSSSKENNN